MSRRRNLNPDFTCAHCRVLVPAAPALSGVQHRNHCPYCLWSRHLDLVQGGDRLSACRAPMRPIGLTLKRVRNKYARDGGELMLIHRCEGCRTLSINRIAADDLPDLLFELFLRSETIGQTLRVELRTAGIRLLARRDQAVVERQLLGKLVSI